MTLYCNSFTWLDSVQTFSYITLIIAELKEALATRSLDVLEIITNFSTCMPSIPLPLRTLCLRTLCFVSLLRCFRTRSKAYEHRSSIISSGLEKYMLIMYRGGLFASLSYYESPSMLDSSSNSSTIWVVSSPRGMVRLCIDGDLFFCSYNTSLMGVISTSFSGTLFSYDTLSFPLVLRKLLGDFILFSIAFLLLAIFNWIFLQFDCLILGSSSGKLAWVYDQVRFT